MWGNAVRHSPTPGIIIITFLFDNAELVLTYTAKWAYPILGNILKCSTGLNAVIGIAHYGIVFVSAYITYILFHTILFFNLFYI